MLATELNEDVLEICLLKKESEESLAERINKLVSDNIYLARHIAAKFCKRKNDLNDSEVLSIAYIGLFKAAKTYNESKGAFSTWATKVIRTTIYEHHRRSKKSLVVESISEDEIDCSAEPEYPEDKLYEWLKTDNEDDSVVKRNKQIALMYLEHQSYAEIGRYFGISRERVRQCISECVKHIQKTHKLEIENLILTNE